jgi:hypothetical protein
MSDELDETDEAVRLARMAHGLAVAQPSPLDPVPPLIAELYDNATQPLRAKVLECLLRPVGPLALVAIAAGAFGSLLHRGAPYQLSITLDDVARISANQMLELARFVEQCGPEAFDQVASVLTDNPGGMAAASASALALLVRLLRR